MSVNAFYGAMTNTQNALGDPRGDARKREQEDMRNAMLQRQMQMREFEFGQQEQEAQRAERQRQLEATRQKNLGGFIANSVYPNRAPTEAVNATPAMPMTGGAPVEQAQGQAFIDPETGQEGVSYTATAQSRGPIPTQEEILQFQAKDAYARGDYDYGNSRIELLRKNMTEEEKRGREMLALAARPIIKLPTHEARVQAVKQAMMSMGISADQTKIDDFFNDPQGLLLELELAEGMGLPEDKIKANISVGQSFDQFRPFERQVLGNRVAPFNPRTGEFGDGPSIGISQEAIFKEGQSNARNAADNATSRANSMRNANRPVFGDELVGDLSGASVEALVAAARGGR